MLRIHQSKPPKTLGRFEVGAKIGGGGMATVYLGRDTHEDGNEELVALKVIRDEFAQDEQFTAMFVDEAKILARLSHPNVIQTLEYGVSGHHRFIAMELLNGRTVADLWDVLIAENGRFDLGTAAWICARVAEGLHSAHELVDETGSPLGVIHRDVNPTNIFLTHAGEVKLIDFGLARARVRVSKSADGIIKGKIPYLAPEQAKGLPIDRRIDIYALGTTLWEMATMKRLFKRDNDVETLKAIRDAYVPNPREENRDFPETLWKIIDRSLRRDRDERYGTAEEMRTDLDAFARTTGPHAQRVAAIVERLFPGGEARQAMWLRNAAAVRIPEEVMSPPAPVPIASSSLLEERPTPASLRTPSSSKVLRSEAPPEKERVKTASGDLERGRGSSPLPHTPSKPSERARRKANRKSGSKSDRRSKTRKKRRRNRRERGNHHPVPKAPSRKPWMIIAALLGALLVVALLASR